MIDCPQYDRALYFAIGAHGKQERKYEGIPYWHHCKNVADLVSAATDDVAVIQAAVLHDTLEDTHITYEVLRYVFGERVAKLVLEVTDVSKPEDGNRETRKEKDRQHYAKSSPEGATIKLADLIDNTRSISKHDKNFAKVYLPEKRRLLEVLKHGNEELYNLAEATCFKAEQELNEGK